MQASASGKMTAPRAPHRCYQFSFTPEGFFRDRRCRRTRVRPSARFSVSLTYIACAHRSLCQRDRTPAGSGRKRSDHFQSCYVCIGTCQGEPRHVQAFRLGTKVAVVVAVRLLRGHISQITRPERSGAPDTRRSIERRPVVHQNELHVTMLSPGFRDAPRRCRSGGHSSWRRSSRVASRRPADILRPRLARSTARRRFAGTAFCRSPIRTSCGASQ